MDMCKLCGKPVHGEPQHPEASVTHWKCAFDACRDARENLHAKMRAMGWTEKILTEE